MQWTTIGSWLLVAAVAIAAHVFGRESRALSYGHADAAAVRRSRIGVALSITGPLVALIVGVIAAAVTGQWAVSGLVTVLAIVAIAAIGLYLAPD